MNPYTCMSEFLPDIALRASGADENLCKHEIEATIRELCEDGLAWPVQYGPLTLKANQERMYLDPLPHNAVVGYVQQVLFRANGDQKGGYRKKLVQLAGTPASWQESNTEPAGILHEAPGTLLFNPVPTEEYEKGLLIDMTVIPLCWESQLPKYFWTHYRDAITDGVLSRLRLMPGKPFHSTRDGEYRARKFRNHIKRIRALTRSRWGHDDEYTWSFPPFASGRPFGGINDGFSGRGI